MKASQPLFLSDQVDRKWLLYERDQIQYFLVFIQDKNFYWYMQWRKMGWKSEGVCKEIIILKSSLLFKEWVKLIHWVKEKEKKRMKHIEKWREHNGINEFCIDIKDFHERKICKIGGKEVMIKKQSFNMNCWLHFLKIKC